MARGSGIIGIAASAVPRCTLGGTQVETEIKQIQSPLLLDKKLLKPHFDAIERLLGITDTKIVPLEELYREMLESGVRPEDNIGSTEILRMRGERE
jgi:hypothetical protein